MVLTTIDLLLDIMPEAENVFAQTRTLVHAIEGEDLGVALVNFKGGAVGTVEGGTCLYPGYPERLEIFGEKGSIILEGGHITQWNIKGRENPIPNTQVQEKSGSSDPMAIDYKYHKFQIKDMAEAIWDDREPQVNGEAARKSLALLSAIYRSAREHKPVEVNQQRT